MCTRSPKAVALAVALSFLAVPATAQSFWLDHGAGELSLEVLRPTPSEDDFTSSSFAAFATAAVQLGEKTLLVVELPVSRGQWDFVGAEGQTAPGNPYVGLRSSRPDGTGGYWSVGSRFPLASEDKGAATGVGVLSAASDRYEAFIPNLFAFNVAGGYAGRVGEVATVSGRMGAMVDVPTDDADVEVFVLYGAGTRVGSGGLNAGLGLSGRYLLTETDMDFRDRTVHEVGIWADYAFGSVRPGIRVQLPVGEQLSDFVDQVVGLYVRYELP